MSNKELKKNALQPTWTVEQAKPEHSHAIWFIAKSRQLPHQPDDPQEIARQGFLIFVMDEPAYTKVISGSRHMFVAIKNGEVLGYLMAYSSLEAIKMGKSADPVLAAVKKYTSLPFLYIDQIAVAQAMGGQGIAQSLLEKLYESEPGMPIFAAVAVSPCCNEASIRFFRDHNNWEPIVKIAKGEAMGEIYSYNFPLLTSPALNGQ